MNPSRKAPLQAKLEITQEQHALGESIRPFFDHLLPCLLSSSFSSLFSSSVLLPNEDSCNKIRASISTFLFQFLCSKLEKPSQTKSTLASTSLSFLLFSFSFLPFSLSFLLLPFSFSFLLLLPLLLSLLLSLLLPPFFVVAFNQLAR